MFSKLLEASLNGAFTRARKKRHEFITVEHLLLALLDDDPETTAILTALGARIESVRGELSRFIDETTPQLPLNIERDIQPTLSFQRVLQRAIYQVQSAGELEVTGINVLTAIFGEQDSQAVYFLNQENITRMDVINFITQGVSKRQRDIPYQQIDFSHPVESPREPLNEESAVEQYATNLNEKAALGKLDPLIGREAIMDRCIQVLCRRGKNNPLFVGEAGVGKTAIAEGLAQRIVDHQVPELLAHCTVYSLDIGILLAGTKYRGDFEKRFKAVLNALNKHTGAIIFIDEIHNLVGAGSATGGTMDASNLIKPLLSAGDLRCMGATTYDDLRNFLKDRALIRRFEKIDVPEPTVEEAIQILNGLKPRFERYHEVEYSDEALEKAVELSARYITEHHLPDKAIDVIDEAGAYQRLQPVNKRKKVLCAPEIIEIISKMARIPIQKLSSSDKQLLKNLPQYIKKVVFGQEAAIDLVTDAIKLSRSGLRDHDKPVGSFLFAGPTGVGKTEVSRCLANYLGVKLLRFDMSEYMERHAISRLIGAPPGYVGYEQGGLLTEAVIKHPHAVLLLDEIEKAHPDLFNILLQVMDYGQLTDNNGRKADFRHVILIMTTNAGADALEKNSVGFVEQNNKEEDRSVAIVQLFSPEFRNRLDTVVQFSSLNRQIILKIVDKEIRKLREQLGKKGIILTINSSAKQWLATQGYDSNMGARPMARIIQQHLKQPLAEEILFGRLCEGSKTVFVSVKNDQLHIKLGQKNQVVDSLPM